MIISARLMITISLTTSDSPEQHIQNSYSEIFVKTYRCLMKLSEVSLLNKSRMGKFKGYEKLFAQAEEELRLQQDQTE